MYSHSSLKAPGKEDFCSHYLESHNVTLRQNETARRSLHKGHIPWNNHVTRIVKYGSRGSKNPQGILDDHHLCRLIQTINEEVNDGSTNLYSTVDLCLACIEAKKLLTILNKSKERNLTKTDWKDNR